MDPYSIGYMIGQRLMDVLTVGIAVFFLAIMGPTTFLMLCGLTVLASIVMVATRF